MQPFCTVIVRTPQQNMKLDPVTKLYARLELGWTKLSSLAWFSRYLEARQAESDMGSPAGTPNVGQTYRRATPRAPGTPGSLQSAAPWLRPSHRDLLRRLPAVRR